MPRSRISDRPQVEERIEQGLAQPAYRRICPAESRRWLGREALAGGAIWRSGAQALAADGSGPIGQLWPGRRGSFAREVEAASGGAARPMKGSVTELIALTRRARIVYRRRHGAAASGGGIASSSRGDFWADGSGAQRALRNAEHCAAQPGERDLARAPGVRR